ncbi:hypothetical protein C8R44DRAFT_986802 [Mycena epipterygia]|nr:hypothetical protein C8R44DRAFT_986802 [Mycena epipterygia]
MSTTGQPPTVTVDVGAQSTSPGGMYQFRPNVINAPNGTVVSFRFSGIPGNHTVTQSTFAAPCEPLSNGFDSGFIAGRETKLGVFPRWNFTVTNDQNPAWFYCKQHTPSHCNAGMVGVINVQAARNSFADFQAKAEGSPIATSSAPRVTSSTTLQGASTSLAPSSGSTPTKSVPVAAIAGASIGALLLLALCVAALLFRFRVRRRARLEEGMRPDPLILYEKAPLPPETPPVLITILREIGSLRRLMRGRSLARVEEDPPPTYSVSA